MLSDKCFSKLLETINYLAWIHTVDGVLFIPLMAFFLSHVRDLFCFLFYCCSFFNLLRCHEKEENDKVGMNLLCWAK